MRPTQYTLLILLAALVTVAGGLPVERREINVQELSLRESARALYDDESVFLHRVMFHCRTLILFSLSRLVLILSRLVMAHGRTGQVTLAMTTVGERE